MTPDNETAQARRSALLDKISALLAKTQHNGCTKAEALAVAELAQNLPVLVSVGCLRIPPKANLRRGCSMDEQCLRTIFSATRRFLAGLTVNQQEKGTGTGHGA